MIGILGESASGKSTMQKMLVESNPELYKTVILYTTRPPRANEKDTVDYYFIDKNRFDELESSGFFIETAKYHDWYYGMAKEDATEDFGVAVLTPFWLRRLLKREDDSPESFYVYSIYLYVDRESRLCRAIQRGDDIDEAYRRNLSEVGQFDGIETEVNKVIYNPGYILSETECLDIIRKWTNEGDVIDGKF